MSHADGTRTGTRLQGLGLGAVLVASIACTRPDLAPSMGVAPVASVVPVRLAESLAAPTPHEVPAQSVPPSPPSRAVVIGEIRRSDDDSHVAGQIVALVDEMGLARETTTDARGVFQFVGVATERPFELRTEASGRAAVRLPSLVLDPDEWRDVGTLRLGPPIHVVVRVRTWADEPVVGATVEAFRHSGHPAAGDRRGCLVDRHGNRPAAVARIVSDPSGEAVFADTAAGEWTFAAHARGFASDGRTLHVGPRAPVTATIRLERGAALEGRVLDADGAPAPGTIVTLGGWNAPDPWRPFRTVAGADGGFAFEEVSSGYHALSTQRPGQPPMTIARVSVPELSRLDLRLPRETLVRGVVVDVDTGLPLEGAIVCSFGNGGGVRATSDARGRYEVVAAAPLGDLAGIGVFKEGFGLLEDEHERYIRTYLRPGDVVTRDFRLRRGMPSVPLPWPGPFVGLSPAREPHGSIRGVVVDAGGRPESGADMRISDHRVAVSDADGAFLLDDVTPGRCVVDAATQDRHGRTEAVVTSGGATAVTVRLTARDVVVRGRVRMSDGAAPPSGTRVVAECEFEGGTPRDAFDADPGPVLQTGEFSMRVNATAARFIVRARAPRFSAWFWDGQGNGPLATDAAWTSLTEVRADVQQDLVFEPGAELAGRVVARETGAPVSGAWLLVRQCCILGSWANPVRATTDADGRFGIPHVFPGRWAVGVEAPGFAPTALWVDAGSAPVTFALDRDLAIEGFVRFPDGRPAEGAVVRAVRERCEPLNPARREDRSQGVVDSAGHFRVTELPPGRFTLEAGPLGSFDAFVLPTRVSDVEAGSKGLEILVREAVPAREAPRAPK